MFLLSAFEFGVAECVREVFMLNWLFGAGFIFYYGILWFLFVVFCWFVCWDFYLNCYCDEFSGFRVIGYAGILYGV